MSVIKPSRAEEAEGWHSVMDPDGVMRCSCGRELIKMDENTYRCSYGFPAYRFDLGEVMMDKFGNLLIKDKSHDSQKNTGKQK